MCDAPLVTFALFAYKQEPTIKEAIAATFAQTYSPLEIILSDDDSPDRTFQIIKEMACAYRGPHRVRVNRNDRNLGITAHINRIMELASGELIVVAAGDDLSYPDRTRTLVTAWLAMDKKPDLLHSAVRRLGLDGTDLGIVGPQQYVCDNVSIEEMARRTGGIMGSSAAWTRRLWNKFGSLDPQHASEDIVMPFRAALSGGTLYIDEPLVGYRVGGITGDFKFRTGRDVLFGSWIRYQRIWRDAAIGQLSALEQHLGAEPTPLRALCLANLARYDWTLRLAEAPYLKRPKLVAAMLTDSSVPLRMRMRLAFMYLAPWLYIAHFWLRRRAQTSRASN